MDLELRFLCHQVAGSVGRSHQATFSDENEIEEGHIVSHCYEIPNPINRYSVPLASKNYIALKHNVSQPRAASLVGNDPEQVTATNKQASSGLAPLQAHGPLPDLWELSPAWARLCV